MADGAVSDQSESNEDVTFLRRKPLVSSQRDLALSRGLDQPCAGYCPEPRGSHNELAAIGTALRGNIAEHYRRSSRSRWQHTLASRVMYYLI